VRDVGALLWVVLVIVGVVSSIVKTARKAQPPQSGPGPVPGPRFQTLPPPAQRPPQPQPPPRQVQQPPRPAARPRILPSIDVTIGQAPPLLMPAEIPVVAPEHAEPRPSAGSRPLRWLFEDRRAMARAVIAAEVLGKPLALRDE
jgi:hypothetical protein